MYNFAPNKHLKDIINRINPTKVMKKNLLGIFASCALVMGFASCSTEAIDTTAETATKSSEVNLYLGGVKASSRACDVSGNMWESLPAYPTEEEKAGILEYVRKNPGAKVNWPGYTYYYVQHVTAAHNMYSYTDWNNAKHDNIDGSSHLDWLGIKEVRELNSWEKDENGNPYSWVDLYTHVNNFNAGKCDNAATHNAALMTQGFAGARAHDSYGDTNCDDWALYYWEGNYYLCIDYKMSKDDGHIDADGIYDDWIVKILPGKGETPVVPDGYDKKDDKKDDGKKDDGKKDDVDSTTAKKGEVEFDIHEQIHKDWNEIKTSVHVRDTAAVHINLPIPLDYQAVADDFAIRSGKDYAYTEVINASFTLAGKEYTFPVKIEHNTAGIDIYIDCTTDEAKEALKIARGVYDDGITFEIHSYVKPEVSTDQIWEWLKLTKLPDTKTAQWPAVGDICTHTYGQVSSAYKMDEMIKYDERPQE